MSHLQLYTIVSSSLPSKNKRTDGRDEKGYNTQFTNPYSLIHGLSLILFILICTLDNFASDCCLQIFFVTCFPILGGEGTNLGRTLPPPFEDFLDPPLNFTYLYQEKSMSMFNIYFQKLNLIQRNMHLISQSPMRIVRISSNTYIVHPLSRFCYHKLLFCRVQ